MRRAAVWIPAAVGLIAVLLVGAELAVRAVASHEVSSVARRELRASSASIDFGTTPVLLDLVRNRAGSVHVTATDADLCALPGVDLAATFHDLTLHGGHRVSSTDADVTLTARGLTRFADSLLPSALDVSVRADPGAGTLDLTLGPAGAVRVQARPILDGDRLSLTPRSVTLLGQRVSAATLDRFTGGGGLGRDLDDLPLGLAPTSARVTSAGLALAFHGGPATLDHVAGGC